VLLLLLLLLLLLFADGVPVCLYSLDRLLPMPMLVWGALCGLFSLTVTEYGCLRLVSLAAWLVGRTMT
jgi:hypothetical protein